MSEPLQLKIKRLRDGVTLPRRMTEHSSGLDLSASLSTPVTLESREIRMIPCGFAMAIPPGYEAQVRPRSGLSSKFGVTLINTPGTIDSDYRGEVHVPLINHGPAAFTIEPNMRIAQMVVMPVPPVEVIEVTELDTTQRGPGGFGHTGNL